jgi:energy-coupling factor transport system permease protein
MQATVPCMSALCAHAAHMDGNAATYSYGETPLHQADPRVKIVLLVAYSVTLFCIHTWLGMLVCAATLAGCMVAARLHAGACLRQLLPVWVILGITLLVNSFTFDVGAVAAPSGLGAVSAGALDRVAPVPIAGTWGFAPAGFARGCFYVLRIVLLVFASLVLTVTTSSTELSRSLERALSPLERLGVRAHDVATTISVALRFIPVTFDEFQQVKMGQQSRGAPLSAERLTSRLTAWQTVFIPLLVGLFRRADRLATAMDVRCYGMGVPTHLNEMSCTKGDAIALAVGLAGCIIVSAAL